MPGRKKSSTRSTGSARRPVVRTITLGQRIDGYRTKEGKFISGLDTSSKNLQTLNVSKYDLDRNTGAAKTKLPLNSSKNAYADSFHYLLSDNEQGYLNAINHLVDNKYITEDEGQRYFDEFSDKLEEIQRPKSRITMRTARRSASPVSRAAPRRASPLGGRASVVGLAATPMSASRSPVRSVSRSPARSPVRSVSRSPVRSASRSPARSTAVAPSSELPVSVSRRRRPNVV